MLKLFEQAEKERKAQAKAEAEEKAAKEAEEKGNKRLGRLVADV